MTQRSAWFHQVQDHAPDLDPDPAVLGVGAAAGNGEIGSKPVHRERLGEAAVEVGQRLLRDDQDRIGVGESVLLGSRSDRRPGWSAARSPRACGPDLGSAEGSRRTSGPRCSPVQTASQRSPHTVTWVSTAGFGCRGSSSGGMPEALTRSRVRGNAGITRASRGWSRWATNSPADPPA